MAPGGGSWDTVIVFDWDDTLMCSTAINSNQYNPSQVAQLERAVDFVLQCATRLGEVAIVTNADRQWVLESSRRFMPQVLPLIANRIAVMSARATYEMQYPGDPFAWKRQAFKDYLASRQMPTSTGLNLVVLGDSPAEMEAAQTSTLGIQSPLIIKTVKFKETPTVDELVEQLNICAQEMTAIVGDDKSCCRNLVNWMRPQMPMPPPQAPKHTAATIYAAPSAAAQAAQAQASAAFAYGPGGPIMAAGPYRAPANGAYLSAPMIYASAGH
jgi:hypothetical protein